MLLTPMQYENWLTEYVAEHMLFYPYFASNIFEDAFFWNILFSVKSSFLQNATTIFPCTKKTHLFFLGRIAVMRVDYSFDCLISPCGLIQDIIIDEKIEVINSYPIALCFSYVKYSVFFFMKIPKKD